MVAEKLKATMFLTLALIFALAFGVIYALIFYTGIGIYGIFGITILFFLLQWYASPALIRFMGQLKYIGPNEQPKLHSLVTQLANQAKVPVPKIAISPRSDPNAYVFGRTRDSATLVVHQGLLPMLNDKEMESVLAHEIGHLRHNDVVVMMLVSFLPMVVYMIARSLMFSGMYSDNRNNGGIAALVGVVAFVAYFVLQLMILSLSRIRESYADEYSAITTKAPETLASSLLKIGSYTSANPAANDVSPAKTLYLADPFTNRAEMQQIREHAAQLDQLLPGLDIENFIKHAQKEGSGAYGILNKLFSNHPPIYKRILALAELKKEIKV